MTDIPVTTEKCPDCELEIKWNEQKTTGECPKCHKEFISTKIRFL